MGPKLKLRESNLIHNRPRKNMDYTIVSRGGIYELRPGTLGNGLYGFLNQYLFHLEESPGRDYDYSQRVRKQYNPIYCHQVINRPKYLANASNNPLRINGKCQIRPM